MNVELMIARRLRLRPDERGLSPSIVIAVVGIALSLIIMMASLCIVLGFKNEIRNKVMGFDAHVSIVPGNVVGSDADNFIEFDESLRDIVEETEMFAEPSLILDQPGIIKTDSDFEGIVLRGIDSGKSRDFISENILYGTVPDFSLEESKNKIVLSAVIANRLGLSVGDRVYAYFFTGESVRARRLDISGIYDTHFSDYDRMYVFGSLALTQGLNSLDSLACNKVELFLHDTTDIDGSAMMLQNAMMHGVYEGRLAGAYRLSTVNSTGMMYFNWLDLLDTNVVVILVLMGLVSGFTLISSLFILILERINMIGILKALGSRNGSISRIFVYLAQKLVLTGMLIGNVVGIGLMLAQKYTHFIPLSPDAYYLSYVPIEVNWWYILALNVGVFVVSWAMLLIPGRMIAKISPASSIRFE
ncbi:MAG: FtsX-like permease family protein [Muribaculum sp.]|nr:FtsX-like permease family protein [Muribaculum sp.]